ncbi:response regulator [Litchfieldella xinjiangensis]|uniref:response regulator n=1 Tax=Litchfieldella xinjiangensis TaxID=1166948 RepID=UPI0006950891|nr:response regulator [Halomonas xinjiangensis]
MRVQTRPESLWRSLIWPTLWPLLVVQSGLVALCILAWAILWRSTMSPSQAWQALTWLSLALLIGTGLTTTTFLLLLRHRLQRWELSLGVPFDRLERIMRSLHKELPSWLKSQRLVPAAAPQESPVARLGALIDGLEVLMERLIERPHLVHILERLNQPAFITHHNNLVAANASFEALFGRSLSDMRGLDIHYLMRPDVRQDKDNIVRLQDHQGQWQVYRLVRLEDLNHHAMGILENINEQQQSLTKMTLLRDRAREESRLKSTYLSLMQRELDDALHALDESAAQGSLSRHGALRERLADLATLVSNLAGSAADDADDLGTIDPDQASAALLGAGIGAEAKQSRILIVDDGPVNTMLARRVLEAQGLTVDTAQSGKQALEMGAERHYDLVFMDIYMPDLDGVETSRCWRQRESHAENARPSVLIALTANAGDDDRERYFAAGMNDFLPKPYRPQALLDMVAHWLPAAMEEAGQ